MNKSIWTDLLKLLAIGAAIWAFFAIVPLFPDKPDLSLSIDNEEKLGKLLLEDIVKEQPGFKELHNPLLDSAMEIVTDRLTDNIGFTDYEYNILVAENPEINAFTLPGGNIVVFSGLIEFTEDPEELAAVLAHEIGHVEQRHVVSKLAKEIGIAVLVGLLTNGDPMLITQISKTALSTVFDREQEREADQYGLNLLVKAKIDPQALAVFFKRLEKEKGGYNEKLEILMTHPNNNSRIKASMEYKTPEGFSPELMTLDWDSVKVSLN